VNFWNGTVIKGMHVTVYVMKPYADDTEASQYPYYQQWSSRLALFWILVVLGACTGIWGLSKLPRYQDRG
jgi:hypothetical protein